MNGFPLEYPIYNHFCDDLAKGSNTKYVRAFINENSLEGARNYIKSRATYGVHVVPVPNNIGELQVGDIWLV